MKKLIMGVMVMSILSIQTGCRISDISENPITIDYADYSDDFMIHLAAGQKYILKNGETLLEFCAKSTDQKEENQILKYGEYQTDISNAVHYKQTEPVLIHINDNDYIWLCDQTESKTMLKATGYYVSQYDSLSKENYSINIKIDDNILDPNDFVMTEVMDCFGMVFSEIHYRIGEYGKPEVIESDDKCYSINEADAKEILCLDSDIHTWVYADADTEEYTVENIPAGTTFNRLRIPKDEEYSYAEGILEDGRVFRVIEEEKFSEPTSYVVMLDMDGHQFEYSVVASEE